MLKKITIFLVLLFSLNAIIILIITKHRQHKNIAKIQNQTEPSATIEDFLVYNYKIFKIHSIFSGKIAYFTEPNIINFFVFIKGTRYGQKTEEQFFAESAKILLDMENYEDLFKKSVKVISIEFEDKVKFNIGDETLEVTHAIYNAKTNKIFSNKEVILTGDGKNIKSKEGFEYDLEREELLMKGNIEGVVYPH